MSECKHGVPDIIGLCDECYSEKQVARLSTLEQQLLAEKTRCDEYMVDNERLAKERDEAIAWGQLTCGDVERLRSALSWMGYATPEGLENCCARQTELVRDLIRAVLDHKHRKLAEEQQG